VKRFHALAHYSKLSNFLRGGVSVNQDHSSLHAYPGARIERCEFESLLERAMEILSARAKSASSPHT
jgi:hypothetical protein